MKTQRRVQGPVPFYVGGVPRLPSLATINGFASGLSRGASAIQLTPTLLQVAPAGSLDNSTVSTVPRARGSSGYEPIHRKPKPKRYRKGWGPYRSVLKERSVEFNMTLDVQNLQQEIQQLTTTRDLLQSRVLQSRHSPTGSLMQLVREYFQLFRQGFRVEEQPRRRRHVITAGVQRDFLYSLIDEHMDFGGGRGGIAFMVEMIRRYSLLIRFICMKMDSFTVVLTDDDQGVMVKAKGTLRFQVLRETVMAIFPHIVGNEWLCSQLIGAEVEAPTMITFNFNDRDRLCGYAPDADYITAFNQVLHDPRDVLELMAQSKIGEKSMFGVNQDGELEEVAVCDYDHEPEPEQSARPSTVSSQQPPAASPKPVSPTGVYQPLCDEHVIPTHHDQPHTETQASSSRVTHKRLRDGDASPIAPFSYPAYLSVVGRYMLVFANGWQIDGDDSDQRKFLHQFVSPQVIVGGYGVGHQAIEQIWKSLGTCFELVGFRASAPPQLFDDEAGDDQGRDEVCVQLRVAYTLAIDISSLQRVFPHVLRHPALVQALLGMEFACPSEVWFEWHAGVVTRVRERLHWDEALTPLVPVASQHAFVLTEAALSPEGFVVASGR